MTFNLEKFRADVSKSRSFEEEDVINLADQENIRTWVSTQVPTLDYVLGKGLPVGKLVEISGDYGSGKSLILTHILAEAISKGGAGILLENESAMELKFMENIGLEYSKIQHYRPRTLANGYEKILTIIEQLQRLPDQNKPPFTVIGWDSITAAPTVERLGETSTSENSKDIKVGLNMRESLHPAAIHASWLPSVIPLLQKHNILLIFINQLRDLPGVMYGASEETPGGRALKFYSTIRLKFMKGKRIQEGDTVMGAGGWVQTFKNRVAPPHRRCDMQIFYDRGFDKTFGIGELLVKLGIITVEGRTYSYAGEKLASSKGDFTQYLKDNPKQLQRFRDCIEAQ